MVQHGSLDILILLVELNFVYVDLHFNTLAATIRHATSIRERLRAKMTYRREIDDIKCEVQLRWVLLRSTFFLLLLGLKKSFVLLLRGLKKQWKALSLFLQPSETFSNRRGLTCLKFKSFKLMWELNQIAIKRSLWYLHATEPLAIRLYSLMMNSSAVSRVLWG